MELVSIKSIYNHRKCSQYSNWLHAAWSRGCSSSPSRVQNFHVSVSTRSALGIIQSSIKCVTGSFPGVKWPGCEVHHSSPITSTLYNLYSPEFVQWFCVSVVQIPCQASCLPHPKLNMYNASDWLFLSPGSQSGDPELQCISLPHAPNPVPVTNARIIL